MALKWVLASLLCTSGAWAADAWSVLPVESRGVDDGVAETFQDLLANEISGRTGSPMVSGTKSCRDVPCARQEGNAIGATHVVYSRLSRLGENIITSVTAVEVASGEVASQKMSVNRVEDLEEAAARLAEAIVTGKSVDETAQLGQITDKEVAPDRRREGQSGTVVRVGGVVPTGDSLSAGGGVLFDLGWWYEGRDFSIEPHFGYRTNASGDDDQSYHQFNFDVGANYILTRSDIAPFVGLGGGMRWVYEGRRDPVTAGSNFKLVSDDLNEDSGWGPGIYGRAGLLLFRTYTMRMAFEVQYDATFVDLHDDKKNEVIQAMNFGVSVMF